MKTFKEFLNEEKLKVPDLANSIEKDFNIKLKPGRNIINGYPFDAHDGQETETAIAIDAVDGDAVKPLVRAFRTKGYEVEFKDRTILISK